MATSDLNSDTSASETNGHGALMTVGGRMGSLAPVPWPYGPPSRPEILSAKASPAALLHALRRRWMLAVGAGVVVAVSMALAVWFVVPVKFEAVSLLRVNSRDNPVLQSVEQPVDYLSFKRTQQALIKSHYVVSRALLDLKAKEPGLNIFRDHPDDAVEWLEDNLNVDYPGDSEVMRVSLRGNQVRELAKLVNAVTNTYMQEIVNQEQEQLLAIKESLDKNLTRNSEDIGKRQQTINKMQKQLRTAGSETAVIMKKLEVDRLNNLTLRASRAAERISEIETKIKLFEARAEKLKDFRPPERLVEAEYAKDPELMSLYKERSDLMQIFRRTASVRTDGGGKQSGQTRASLMELEDKIEERKMALRPDVIAGIIGTAGVDGSLVPLLQVERASYEAELDSVNGEITKQMAVIEKLENTNSELQQQQTTLKNLQQITDQIANKLNALRVELENYKVRVKVIETATDPRSSDAMRKYMGMGFASLVGLGLVLFGVAFVELQSRKLNSSRDVHEGLGIRVMGDLPPLSGKLLRQMQAGKDASLEHLLTESIDSIRTALIHSNGADPPRVVLVTSADSREGKTTVASQLAASLARSGRKTLLVDGDVRNPAAHQLFGRSLGPGLCDVVRGEIELEGTIQPSDSPNLWLLPAGEACANSVQAFSSDSLTKVIDHLRTKFDFIIVDSPPVLKVADPLLLGLHADTAVLSVQRDISKMPDVYAASERLRSVGIHVLGAVVNGVQMKVARRSQALPAGRSA